MTTMKSVILSAALGLCSLTFASAKSYNVVLTAPAAAGAFQLSAGAYTLNVDGRIATFTNVETNKSVMIVVRQDAATRAFDRTAVDVKDENGAARLESIELAGSTNVLEF